MPQLALADALRDFGSRPAVQPAERVPAPIEIALPQPPTIDIDSIVAAEVQKTEADVTERLSAVYEHTLQAERDKHAAELAALRAELGGRAGDMIALRLAEIEAVLIQTTTAATARILAGMASDDLQRRSIDALSRAISDAIRDTDAVKIRVSGPLSLYEALRQAIGPRANGFDFRETAGFDLSVEIDGNLLETRLGEWASVVSEVIA